MTAPAAEHARLLQEATRDRRALPPLRERWPGMTLDDAYAVQTAQLETALDAGRRLVGRKIGLTSTAMQQQLGVDQPDFGWVLDDMVYGPDAQVPVDRFIAPKVEPELALRLGTELRGPGVTLESARAAVESVHAAIEIIDSRVADWNIRLVDTVADNASCGAVVIGDALPVAVDGLDAVGCALVIDGEPRERGTGADVLGDPVAPLVWLANLLGERGVALEAGQYVLTGSFTRALPVVAGERIRADYGELGSLDIDFIDSEKDSDQ